MVYVTMNSLSVAQVEGVTISAETGRLVIFASPLCEKGVASMPIEIIFSEMATTSLLETLKTINGFRET